MSKDIQSNDVVEYSSVSLGRRIPKTESNPHGWQIVDKIPADDICVLYLGGNDTRNDKTANGGIKNIQTALQHTNIDLENIKLYSAVYNFRKNAPGHDSVERKHLFRKFNRELISYGALDESADTLNPVYIQQLFDAVILPRITTPNGDKKDVKEACKNIRRLTIVAFCHGAYVFLKLEEMMQSKLKELGYTISERNQIQRQLLCVAYAPLAPLGVSKSTMLSFMSMHDLHKQEHNNIFSRFIQSIMIDRYVGEDMDPVYSQIPISYFPEKQGNIFISPRILEKHQDDHGFIGGYNLPADEISVSGKIMLTLAANAIANSLKSALNNTPIPNTEKLVTNDDPKLREIFNEARTSGENLYNQMKKLRFNKARLKTLDRHTGTAIRTDIWQRFGPYKDKN